MCDVNYISFCDISQEYLWQKFAVLFPVEIIPPPTGAITHLVIYLYVGFYPMIIEMQDVHG